MRILYGVQGTGQGHISRARAMAAALAQWPVKVTWLFSGRPRDRLFDMEVFGDFEHRRGLTFTTRGGRVRYGATVVDNNLPQFLAEVRSLDLDRYDIIVSDYEPVVARAGRRAKRRVIGIGHQYAFDDNTPVAGASWIQRGVMSHFAPVGVPVGLHWHPYADNVLPPILDLPRIPVERGEHILVYLPFEDQEAVTAVLQEFPQQRFVQYAATLGSDTRGNVSRYKANVHGFKRHLAGSAGVICNSGFELISECLQWRKPVLTKPLAGQMEQHSNALALQQLGYAATTPHFDAAALEYWLSRPDNVVDIQFPDVAETLACWLAAGANAGVGAIGARLWSQVDAGPAPAPRPEAARRGLISAAA